MMGYRASAILKLLLCCLAVGVHSFHLPLAKTHTRALGSFNKQPIVRERASSAQPLYLWGKNKKDETPAEPANSSEDEAEEQQKRGGLGGLLPFFANKEEKTVEKETKEEPVVAVAARPKPVEEEDPVKKAQALRAQAERARLEAEKMDAELTLRKISKLEREMASAVAKDETDDVERLQREMDALQAKIRGEAPKPVVVAPRPKVVAEPKFELSSSSTVSEPTLGQKSIELPILKKVNEEDYEKVLETLEKSPGFIKKLLAQMTEVDFVGTDDINVTAVTQRMIQMSNFDYSYSNRPKPSFTQSEIDSAIKENMIAESQVDMDKLPEGVKGNKTAEALLALEYNYYVDAYDMSKMDQLLEGEDWLKDMIDAVNKTEVDSTIEIFYPKCTRKEEGQLPTMAQVNMLVADVLPKASFVVRGQPEQVLGGYVVRGTSKFESGDETIAAIDEQLEKSPMLKDKMTVLYSKDFTLFAERPDSESFEAFPNPDDEQPILYIMGADIMPERRRIALSTTTAFGIATSWYFSVYPFLLNPELLKRVEEQLELADASMAYDLSWLSQLSIPLFLTFIGIQLAHEAGHKLVGAANGVPTTFPTFVPSLITGVTSTVTQFKEPPPNKEAIFDVSLAGPLTGMLASLAALVVGSQLTLVSDPAFLPALPLDILRQSTLGGGIIDAILGAGALSVPPGAEASQAVAGMTVSLHPVAIAGYVGMILNGLALLPIGTTDGGRIALALFGRGARSFIGNIFLFTIFLVGILGSDLFLFYFSFVIAFQTGSEIPARNEVDDVGFARVLLATATTVLALLTLIPFQ